MTSQKLPTVLVIDDEPELLEILVEEMEYLGFKTLRANNAIEALAYFTEASLQEVAIHAVLSDINMPQMTGLEMLDKMNHMGLEVPVVFISGYGDKEKAVQAMRLGAMDMLDKPFNRDLLESAMKKASAFGLAMENIESEIDDIISKSPASDVDTQTLRKTIKELLKMKKMRASYFK